MARQELWGLKRLVSRPWPVRSVGVTHPTLQEVIDLKQYVPDDVVATLFLRVRGNIVIAGAGAGAATGRENPEALVPQITLRNTPALTAIMRNALTARGIIVQGIFDRGYAIREADVADAAGTVAIDFILPLVWKMPGSVKPVEWSLPMSLFKQMQLAVSCAGRDQLFTGGVNTWDLTGLNIEVWADFDSGIGGSFNLMEEFENIIPITQTQSDLTFELAEGWLYTHLLFMAERDNVLDDTLINSITVESGGRVWTPQGDLNASMIRRWNRETHVSTAAESLTGVYFIPALRDGRYPLAIDASDRPVNLKLDVTLGGGTTRRVVLHGRKILPQALQVTS